jgi:hypothetical protein
MHCLEGTPVHHLVATEYNGRMQETIAVVCRDHAQALEFEQLIGACQEATAKGIT